MVRYFDRIINCWSDVFVERFEWKLCKRTAVDLHQDLWTEKKRKKDKLAQRGWSSLFCWCVTDDVAQKRVDWSKPSAQCRNTLSMSCQSNSCMQARGVELKICFYSTPIQFKADNSAKTYRVIVFKACPLECYKRPSSCGQLRLYPIFRRFVEETRSLDIQTLEAAASR